MADESTPKVPKLSGTHVVLYDGVCALCNGLVRFLLAHDEQRRFRFAALQSHFAEEALASRGESPKGLSTMFVIANYGTPEERIYKKSRAVLAVLLILGGPWKLLTIIGILPTPILDLGYGAFARLRYALFGRYDSCPIPDPEHRDLFIEV